MSRTPIEIIEPATDASFDQAKFNGAMVAMRTDAKAAQELAVQLGYEGELTIGALEDGIRFYQRRTVEACLELGKRLQLLQSVTPRGEFDERIEALGIARRSAYRFMQAAIKTSKSANLALLSTQVKSASAFLELVTQDDDVLENLAEMDDVDRMSPSQLRAALREAKEEKTATDKVLADKNAASDKLRAQLKRIQKATPDEVLVELQKEATALMNDAVGCIKGNLRQALSALNDHPDSASLGVFMAGLVGQVQAALSALRDEYQLPDVSNAADAALAAEVAQWAK